MFVHRRRRPRGQGELTETNTMPTISVFYGEFCGTDAVVRELAARTGLEPITDREVLADAARISGLDTHKLEKAFCSATSVFNKFTHEKERALAFLRLAVAERLGSESLLVSGHAATRIHGIHSNETRRKAPP